MDEQFAGELQDDHTCAALMKKCGELQDDHIETLEFARALMKEKLELLEEILELRKKYGELQEDCIAQLRELNIIERVADSIRPGDDPCDIQRKLYAYRDEM